MIYNSCFGVIFIEQFIDFTFKPSLSKTLLRDKIGKEPKISSDPMNSILSDIEIVHKDKDVRYAPGISSAEALTGYSNKKAIIKNSKCSVDNGKREKA